MKRSALFHIIWLCVPLSAMAEDIYRCTSSGETIYQGTPCAAGQRATPLVVARTHIHSPSPRAQPCASSPGGRASLPFRRTVLCLGMSDDEVLNLPRWGRPASITRTKAKREWQESWEYRSPAEAPRYLHFVNGRLTSVEAVLDDVVSLAPR
jgi:hypothetical protein